MYTLIYFVLLSTFLHAQHQTLAVQTECSELLDDLRESITQVYMRNECL